MKYIDVSEHQGLIDWEKVKGNVDGVILRAGYGSKGTADKRFQRNAAECNRLGIPFGAYWFSYAKSEEEAKTEAKHLLAAVKPYRVELPLAFDLEYDTVANMERAGVKPTKKLCSGMVHAFCKMVEAAGYWALNYANPDFLARYFDEEVASRYGLWLAQWPNKVDVKNPPRPCAIWQWGGSKVPGINGNVDTDECYQDFRKIIAEFGMNNLKPAYTEDDGSVTWEFTQAQPQKPWYADAMTWMTAQGLYTEERPNDPVTRAELATVLYRIYGPQDEKKDSGLLSE